MVDYTDIDLERLYDMASSSDDGEGYIVVARSDWFKIGLVAMIDETRSVSYSMELLVRLLEEDREVNPSSIKHILTITEKLSQKGYRLTSEDGGWIYAERSITSNSFEDELGFLISLLDN